MREKTRPSGGFSFHAAACITRPHATSSRMNSTALFPELLGDQAWQLLPQVVRAMHGPTPRRLRARGVADVSGATHLPARWLRRLLGLPSPGPQQALALMIERHDAHEIWTRRFAGRPMQSTLTQRDGSPLLIEQLGPATLGFALCRHAEGIDWQPRSLHLFGVPMPRALRGDVLAHSGMRDGRYHFSVNVRLPLLGQLIAYHGWPEAPIDEP